jgi:hypothetical protein
MKTLLTGIALGIVFAMAIGFSTRAHAASDGPDCPYVSWKHGHYVCGDIDATS